MQTFWPKTVRSAAALAFLLDSASAATTQRPGRAPMTGARERTPGRRLCCARCGAFIAERGAASVVNGAHRHVGTNPHGLTFEIGCFEHAPGCLSQGTPDDRWSWFPGYRWQVSLCRACGTHLGWYYRGGGRTFHGLILGQLRACSDGGGDRF